MSSLAPSTWDPKKDQHRIDQLKQLAWSVDAKNEWETRWEKVANELFTILNEWYVVSKNSATIKELEKLKNSIQQREDTLLKGSNDILENTKYIVLQNDMWLIQERIDLLHAIGNPKEEFLMDEWWVFDLKNVYRDAEWSSLDEIKIDPKSVWRWGDKVTVKNLKDNHWIEVTGRKWTVQIVKNDQDVLVIDPIELVDSRLSFSMIWRYIKAWTNHGVDVRRKFAVDWKLWKDLWENEEGLKKKLLWGKNLEINGTSMPHQWLGCFQLQDAEKSILSAINNGSKQLDLATWYSDMKTWLPVDLIIKKLVDEWKLKDMYITSKISPSSLWAVPLNKARVKQVIQQHIDNCGGKIWTLHMHMIPPTYTAEDITIVLDAIKEQVALWNVKTMWMSNCSLWQLQWALNKWYPIKVIQVEWSPYYRDEQLREFCKQQGIIVQVYAPFGGDRDHDQKLMDYDKAKPIDNALIKDIATKLWKTPHQVILRRLIQQWVVPLPQSNNDVHQKQNEDVYDRSLSDEDMRIIDWLNNWSDGSVYTKLYIEEWYFTHDVPVESIPDWFEKYPEVVADFAKKHWFTPEDLALLDERDLKALEDKLNQTFPDDSFNEQNEKICVQMMNLWLKLKGKWRTASVSTPPPGSPPSSPPLLLPPPSSTNTSQQQWLTKQRANTWPLKATISDTRNLFQERALHQADEALRKEYEALWKIGLVSNWRVMDRLKLYLSRELKRGRYMRGYLNQYKQTGADLLNPEMTAAADRHEKMMEHRQEWDHVKHKMQMTAHAVENPAINDLCKRYLNVQPAMQDAVFEQEFQRIASNIPEIRRGLWGNFSFAAWNILLKLRGERSYRRLVLQLRTLSETYFSNRDANAYRTQALQFVRTYVQESKRDIPENIRLLMDAPESIDSTKEWFQHEMGRLAVEAGNLRVAVDVVRGGKGAYEVHNTDRNQNPLAVLWGWLKNHPYISVWITWWTVIAWLLSWHVIIPTAWMWIKYVARKLGDMTLEQKGAENRSVRGLENERARYERLQEMYTNPWDYADNRLQQARIKYDARRQLRLFGGTTHREAMNDIEVTIQSLQDAITSGQDLQPRLADALSRLDSYQHTWHNFLAQQHDQKMEENMNTLQNLVLAWARTLWVSLDAIRWTQGYTAIHTDLSQQYESSLQEFKKQRLYLWIQHAVFYTATAMGLRALLWWWSTSNVNSDLNPNIVDWFSLTDAQTAIVEQKIHDLGPGVTHDKLRTIIFEEKMKDGMTMAEFTTLKNEFMSDFALQMQEYGKNELIANAKNLSLNTSDAWYNKAMAFLTQPHIWICTPADWPSIVAELVKIKANPNYVFDMSADMRRMCAEYCYCFLDWSNTPAWLLWASFHDQKLRIPLITWSLWLPLFSNTFLRDVQGERRAVPTPPPATPSAIPQNPGSRNELPPVSRFDPIVTDPRKQHSLDDWIIDPSAAAWYVQP